MKIRKLVMLIVDLYIVLLIEQRNIMKSNSEKLLGLIDFKKEFSWLINTLWVTKS